MKKLLHKITIISFVLVLFTSIYSYGIDNDTVVRVRVRSPRLFNEQVSLEGFNEIFVYNNSTQDIIFKLPNKIKVFIDAYYDNNKQFTSVDNALYGPYHIVFKGKIFGSFDEAIKEAASLNNSLGVKFYPYFFANQYFLATGNYKSDSEANLVSQRFNKSGHQAEVLNGYLKNIIIRDEQGTELFMYDNSSNFLFSSSLNDIKNIIKIDNRAYRGLFEFKTIEENKLISINYVKIEDYLYGVVPNEISASWEIEAIKAQAVAARTYSIYNISTNSSALYDLEDDQRSQVYRGYDYEKPSTNMAVDTTKGQMIYYNDKIIQAYYHSTSGGMTENSENIWVTPLPYAVSVVDEFSNKSNSPYTQWQKTYYKSEIIQKLNEAGHVVSQLYSVEIRGVSQNNRVLEFVFVTDIGEIKYEKDNARRILGLMSSWFSLENGRTYYFTNKNSFNTSQDLLVPSRDGILGAILEENFVIGSTNSISDTDSGSLVGKYVISKNGNVKINENNLSFISSSGVTTQETKSDEYNFSGRGWGHGIGMSQYGAKQMAIEGFNYQQILKHYYTGVTIKWWII